MNENGKNEQFSLLENLNPAQREAVTHTEGPLLILAGAGSGKTRVIAHRIAFLLETGATRPWQILAVTFTNKAAGEMKGRIAGLVGPASRGIWISTFHSFGARFVRREGEKVGIPRDFAILDAEDSRKLIKQILKQEGYDSRDADPARVASIISRWKNQGVSFEEASEQVAEESERAPRRQVANRQAAAIAYEPYEQERRRRRALDFDDLLLYPLRILNMEEPIRKHYQTRFQYILVDEYQDTNRPQHELLKILAAEHDNICVVGDDDQSIYGWRGAEFRNILDFDRDFPGTHIVRLEQNYRSTQKILTAASGLIRKNRSRRKKELYASRDSGRPIRVLVGVDEENEAEKIAREIRILQESRAGGPRWHDVAVLYRTTAQSRALEGAFAAQRIPYQVVGGIRFYERKEVKDLLAYLRLILNSADDLALERIVNVPPRGVGSKALDVLRKAAVVEGDESASRPLFSVLERIDDVPGIPKATAGRIKEFVDLIHDLRHRALSEEFPLEAGDDEEPVPSTRGLPGITKRAMEESGLADRLKEANSSENKNALENLNELISATVSLTPTVRELLVAEHPETANVPLFDALRVYLETVSLLTDIDLHRDAAGVVSLMTLHSAKGLEFPIIFIAGLEEDLLPHVLSGDRRGGVEEERRLCYVGITRAMERCYLTRALRRMVAGNRRSMEASRFLSEIPDDVLEYEEPRLQPSTAEVGRLPRLLHTSDEEEVGSTARSRSASELEFAVGDTVRHRTFGIGEVLRIEPFENTHRVAVRFERFGEKMFLQRIARMVKV